MIRIWKIEREDGQPLNLNQLDSIRNGIRKSKYNDEGVLDIFIQRGIEISVKVIHDGMDQQEEE